MSLTASGGQGSSDNRRKTGAEVDHRNTQWRKMSYVQSYHYLAALDGGRRNRGRRDPTTARDHRRVGRMVAVGRPRRPREGPRCGGGGPAAEGKSSGEIGARGMG